MVGQTSYGFYAYTDSGYIYRATVDIKKRDVFAEVALNRVNFIDSGDGFWGEIAIIKMVSANGVEHFDPPKQGIFRHKVTQIRIQMTVFSAFARGRLMVNYWS